MGILDATARQYSYNPETGEIRNAEGFVLRAIGQDGYRTVKVTVGGRQKSIRQHRLAFFLMVGRWPVEVDHINGDRSDNRWCNLREVDSSANGKNASLLSNNKSGIHGVCWDSKRKRWAAKIEAEDKRKHLKETKDFFEACCARKSAELKYDYHPNHGKR